MNVVTVVEKLEKLKNDQFFKKPSFSFFERNIERYDGFFRLRDFKKKIEKNQNEIIERPPTVSLLEN